MTYIPLARKWRPKTFADLFGQEHVVIPLQNALQQNKLHQSYLFTGTRGVGKTTVARIFAKSLNCQQGIVTEPCLSCENCCAIDEGRFYDLIEVDAASRTRVEDTRELIENIQYAPASGRFKIFLIDEVHMLSTHSFNALLKTLEEPPEHVKFLLATTDPQKIPATILSRCLQFNLKAITPETISKQLNIILDDEKFSHATETLEIIAQHANGSMRDAITLTEQLMAVFPDGFHADTLKEFLGLSLDLQALKLLQLMHQQDIQGILKLCQDFEVTHPSYHQLLHLLMQFLHQCAITQIMPEHSTNQTIKHLAHHFTADFIQKAYLILEKTNQDLDWSPHASIGFQMCMLRIYQLLAPQLIPASEEPKSFEQATPSAEEVPTETKTFDNKHSDWASIVMQLHIDGIGKSALSNTLFMSKENGLIELQAKPQFMSLFSPVIKDRIESALSNYYQETIKIKLIPALDSAASQSTPAELIQKKEAETQALLVDTVVNNPFIQQLQQDFDAKILEKSMSFTSNDL